MMYKITRNKGTITKTPVSNLKQAAKIYSENGNGVKEQVRRVKVLVVDDEPHIVKLIKLSLDPVKYEVFEAYTGLEAIEAAKTIFPDIIVLDIMMPKMSGYDVCKMLKKNPLTSYIPILMVSAKTELKDKMASIMTGADDYLTKPFDPQELENKIRINL